MFVRGDHTTFAFAFAMTSTSFASRPTAWMIAVFSRINVDLRQVNSFCAASLSPSEMCGE